MDVINQIVIEYPWIGTLLVLMGSLRLIMKPVFTLIDKYVESTPEASDNEKWNEFKNSKAMKAFAWFMDYIASVKLQKGDNSSKPK